MVFYFIFGGGTDLEEDEASMWMKKSHDFFIWYIYLENWMIPENMSEMLKKRRRKDNLCDLSTYFMNGLMILIIVLILQFPLCHHLVFQKLDTWLHVDVWCATL